MIITVAFISKRNALIMVILRMFIGLIVININEPKASDPMAKGLEILALKKGEGVLMIVDRALNINPIPCLGS